jgi:hypothetical protein
MAVTRAAPKAAATKAVAHTPAGTGKSAAHHAPAKPAARSAKSPKGAAEDEEWQEF